MFPFGKNRDGGVGGVGGGGVGVGDGVFHGAAHVVVVEFRLCNVSAVLGVWSVVAAR
jgi:hypothetical protein